jgi:hypothetical protein
MTNSDDKKYGSVVGSTMAETRSGVSVAPHPVLQRLQDWQTRVHQLYDDIQRTLGSGFKYDRTGKHYNAEALVQRAHLAQGQVPPVDILRVEHPNGTLRATVIPRDLWVIGANGRLDLVVFGPGQKRSQFDLIDTSQPLSGPQNATWHVVDPSGLLDQKPLTDELLSMLIS